MESGRPLRGASEVGACWGTGAIYFSPLGTGKLSKLQKIISTRAPASDTIKLSESHTERRHGSQKEGGEKRLHFLSKEVSLKTTPNLDLCAISQSRKSSSHQ